MAVTMVMITNRLIANNIRAIDLARAASIESLCSVQLEFTRALDLRLVITARSIIMLLTQIMAQGSKLRNIPTIIGQYLV